MSNTKISNIIEQGDALVEKIRSVIGEQVESVCGAAAMQLQLSLLKETLQKHYARRTREKTVR
jgi:hypothetical protein